MAYGSILGQTFIAPENPNTIATNVSYNNSSTSSIITGNNVQQAIDQLFTSVSNGKSLIAGAITDKGVSTSADATFQQMATNIGKIGFKVTSESFSRTYIVPDSQGILPAWQIQISRSGYTLWENCFVQITSYNVRIFQDNFHTQTENGNYALEKFVMTLNGNTLSIPVLDWFRDQSIRGKYAATGCTVYYIDPA